MLKDSLSNFRRLIRKVYELVLVKKDLLPKYGWYPSEPESPSWWGGLKSPFEVMISSILVQQTKWENVAKIIGRLNQNNITSFEDLRRIGVNGMFALFRGINFLKRKAETIMNLTKTILAHDNLDKFFQRPTKEIRRELFEVKGIGFETADSILLYAGNHLVMPVSMYTKRVLGKIGVRVEKYEGWRALIESSLKRELYTYKYFFASVITVGRAFCRVNTPDCVECPLKNICAYKKNK